MTEVPETIRCDQVGSYPWRVLHDRHPRIIDQVRSAHAYPDAIHRALDGLLDEISNGVVTALPPTAFDARDWQLFWHIDRHAGRSWYDAPFLWAETYFYRRLLQAVDYFTTGPWWQVDPNASAKADQLAGAVLRTEPADEYDPLLPALWGNRDDLGFRADTPNPRDEPAVDALVVDDTAAVWAHLTARAPLRLGYLVDNAGGELLHDLILIDHLLGAGLAASVTLYVKRYPYYVSDAITADVDACLARLDRDAPAVYARLSEAVGRGVLRTDDHPLFCAPVSYAEVRDELQGAMEGIEFTLAKGDLNYRRLVGDRHWRGTEDFADLVEYFPSPIAVLRTVKSEVVVGVPAQTLRALDAADPDWRYSGRHAMVQARLQPSVR